MSTVSRIVISLLTLFMMMPGCFTVKLTGCPRPDYIMHENGFCCGVVSCRINFAVSMCKVKYGNDTCAPCPEGSFLLDQTTSETATSCTKPSCMKNKTRPSLVKSTTINKFACPQWCECDLSFNYCGTDPCNCQRGTCQYRTVLQQDCGCRPITPSPPKPTPSKEMPVTQRNFTTPKPRINVTTESSASPSASPVDTPTPGSVTPFLPGSTKASDSEPSVAMILGIAVLVAVIIGFIILGCCCYIRFRRMKHKGTKIKTPEPDTKKTVINNYKITHINHADVVQSGDNATTIINSKSNQDDSDGSEDEAAENGGVTQPFLPEQNNTVETEAVIEERTDPTRPDLSIDGLRSSLPGSSSNIQNNVEDEETEVKTVITTNDDAIELQPLSVYAGEKGIDQETNVSRNPLPASDPSAPKQQNGVSSKESRNGHVRNGTQQPFTGFH